jgi:hypothetical protein
MQECAAKIIRSGALGRGHVFPKLIQYLVDRAAQGEVPKEFDISLDVFGKDKVGVDQADAQTRVYIYKLRARLDAYYAGAGKHDPLRLTIPKGAYHVFAVANEHETEAEARAPADSRRSWTYALAALVVLSLIGNVLLVIGNGGTHDEGQSHRDPMWSALLKSQAPILIVVGDHFFFGEWGSGVRMRDIAINSKEDLGESIHYSMNTGLSYDTLSYLPKSVVFGMQTIVPRANASGRNVSLKLVSELTSDDLRDYDVIYVGFVRAMGILKDYYFARSNFAADPPLFMALTHAASGEVYARSGPVPQHNTDYGLLARYSGPAGNQILVFAGIGDVGVLAAVRALNTRTGLELVQAALAAGDVDVDVDAERGFEVLLEARGHSRTDLDLRTVGAYVLGSDERVAPITACCDELPDSRAASSRD